MKNFELRRDRYEAFRQFDNPLLNIGLTLELPEFRPFCKQHQLPPFHFFLYCVLSALESIDNFMYRIHDDEVIRIDDFVGSYTVINADNNLNFAWFERSTDLREFIERSKRAGREAQASRALINTGAELTPRERKNNFYITCMPWFDLRAIEHPIFSHRNADIPSLAWGRFSAAAGEAMTVPFSVQAHHGFVDGYHVHLLAKAIAQQVAAAMAAHAQPSTPD